MLKQHLDALRVATSVDATVRQLLRDTVSGYVPGGEILDGLYQRRRVEP